MFRQISFALIVALYTLSACALDISEYELVDLSHSYGSDTLYWPTSPSKFEKKELAFGKTEGGYFYSAFSICTPEHGGTHLDAPLHFAADGFPTDRVPLENLVSTAVVIDISNQAAKDRNYVLSAADVRAFEDRQGRIAPGTIVLLRTDWSRRWPDARSYLGDDVPGDASNLSFPSYGEGAARLLVEQRQVAVLGVDTASTDFGQSKNFAVHRIAAARNVSNLENLTNLDRLPPTGALVVALPMKIEGGSGGPVRVVALVPRSF
ncbi:MAG: cyclase family protein [Woeseia sp.]